MARFAATAGLALLSVGHSSSAAEPRDDIWFDRPATVSKWRRRDLLTCQAINALLYTECGSKLLYFTTILPHSSTGPHCTTRVSLRYSLTTHPSSTHGTPTR